MIAELHDEKNQPDINDGRSIGIPLDQFIDAAVTGLTEGKEEIPVALAKDWYQSFEPQRQETFHKVNEAMKRMYK